MTKNVESLARLYLYQIFKLLILLVNFIEMVVS